MKSARLLAGALALAAIVLTTKARADTSTWTGAGADSNWSTPGNWSGNAVPDADDLALFDGTSSKDCVIDVDAEVGVIEVKFGYTGTITQAAGASITVNGEWKQDDGTFRGSDGPVAVMGPLTLRGGAFLAGSGVMAVSGELKVEEWGTFDAEARVLDVSGPVTVQGGVFKAGAAVVAVSGVFGQDSGAVDLGAADILLESHLVLAGGDLAAGSSFVRFIGDEDQDADLTITPALAWVAVAKTGGVLRFVKQGFSADGMSIAAGSTVEFTPDDPIVIGELDWKGEPGAPVTVRSLDAGVAWTLVVPEGQWVRYVDVRESDASAGAEITAYSSMNSGGNTHWAFPKDNEPPKVSGEEPVEEPNEFNDHYVGKNVDFLWTGPNGSGLTPAIEHPNVFTSPGWFEGRLTDPGSGVATAEIMSHDGSMRPGFVESTDGGPATWRAPVAFPPAPPRIVRNLRGRDMASGEKTGFQTTLKAADGAGNSASFDDTVVMCPVVILGKGSKKPTKIALQKGDSMLVCAFPEKGEWYYEDYPGRADRDGLIRAGKSVVTRADGSSLQGDLPFPGPEDWQGLYFCEGIQDVVHVTYDEAGEGMLLEFDLYEAHSPETAIRKGGDGNEDPDAVAWVTAFDVDLDAAGLAEDEEETPGLSVWVDGDDDDENDVPDFVDTVDGTLPATPLVLADLVALTVQPITPAQSGAEATLRVFTPGNGQVRLLEKTGGTLAPSPNNQATIPAAGSSDEFYLQGIASSGVPRDVTVVLEYDPDPDGTTYRWKKKMRDVVWVSVGKIELVGLFRGTTRGEGTRTSTTSDKTSISYNERQLQAYAFVGFEGKITPAVSRARALELIGNTVRITSTEVDDSHGGQNRVDMQFMFKKSETEGGLNFDWDLRGDEDGYGYDPFTGTFRTWLAFDRLPRDNSDFGKKTAIFRCTLAGVDVEDTIDYNLFFPIDKANHHDDAGASQNAKDAPNWYYYWSQNRKGKGKGATDFWYDAHGGVTTKYAGAQTYFGAYYKDKKEILLSDRIANEFLKYSFNGTKPWTTSTGKPVTKTLSFSVHKRWEGACDHVWHHELRHHEQHVLEIWKDASDTNDKDKDLLHDLFEDAWVTRWDEPNTWPGLPLEVTPTSTKDREADADVNGGQPHNGRLSENWARGGPRWVE